MSAASHDAAWRLLQRRADKWEAERDTDPAEPVEPSRVWTPAQLAERWDVSIRSVERVLVAGELRGFRVGRLWRVAEGALADYERRCA